MGWCGNGNKMIKLWFWLRKLHFPRCLPFDECKLFRCGGGETPCGNRASSTILSVKLGWWLIGVRAPELPRLWICASCSNRKQRKKRNEIDQINAMLLITQRREENVLTLCVSSACCCVSPDTLSTSAVFKNELSERWCTFTSPW